jgi:hypothetical protein
MYVNYYCILVYIIFFSPSKVTLTNNFVLEQLSVNITLSSQKRIVHCMLYRLSITSGWKKIIKINQGWPVNDLHDDLKTLRIDYYIIIVCYDDSANLRLKY